MAHAALPKIVCKPLSKLKMCPTDFTTSTALSDVLQSDPVKRLLNQPNIVVKATPIKTNATSTSDHNVLKNKSNNLHSNSSRSKPEISVIPLPCNYEGRKEDDNLLPSKIQGKSEITLLPVKRERKPCGHYESCENIICDVAIQQYIDGEEIFPLLATDIEENEINAPVSKHCANKMCDALSIDHDRCRRAVVRLNRCNQSNVCDICGIKLRTHRSRVYHKSCTRKNEYRHNETNGAQILKERMREREIQMMEASKAKQNDYMDPVKGYSLAIEALRNNRELIVIPQTVPSQQPEISISLVSTASSTPTTEFVDYSHNILGNCLPNVPIVFPQQSHFGKSPSSKENSVTPPLQDPLSTTSNAVPLSQNHYITFTTQSNTQDNMIAINDLLLTQSQIMATPIQSKPLLTSIRVVPITNLITEPSLMHQTQGIPKFCIMADNTPSQSPSSLETPTTETTTITTSTSLTVTNSQSIEPSVSVPNVDVSDDYDSPPPTKRKPIARKKRQNKHKDFKCNYCLKSFSTNWYFKVHVAKHTGQKQYPCKICSKSFSNQYDMKRHLTSEHQIGNAWIARNEQTIESSHKCIDCNIIYTTTDELKHHRDKCHKKIECSFCHNEFSTEELDRHIHLMHKTGKSDRSHGKRGKLKVPSNTTEDDNKTNGYI